MTALCGGGTSAAQTGFAAVVDYSSGLIATILAARGLQWLIPIIPLAGLPPLILASFCATDPPAVPTFTSNETNALIDLQFGADFDSGLSKLKDLLLNTLWYDACQCTSGALTPYVAPTPPAGTPITLPPIPGSGVPCSTYVGGLNAVVGFPQQTHTLDYFPPAGFQPTFAAVQVTAATGSGYQYRIGYSINDGVTVTATRVTGPFNAGTLANVTFPLPSGYIKEVFIDWFHDAGTQSGTCNISLNAQVYCNGALPGAQVPCCPPDQATQASLDAILKMVTLVQRQHVPFAFVHSTVHAGLTGTGTLSVQGLLGVKVEITAMPAGVVSLPGNPAYLKDLGWVSVSEVGGMLQELRASRALFTWTPPYMALADTIGYEFFPGVTATITELRAEP